MHPIQKTAERRRKRAKAALWNKALRQLRMQNELDREERDYQSAELRACSEAYKGMSDGKPGHWARGRKMAMDAYHTFVKNADRIMRKYQDEG